MTGIFKQKNPGNALLLLIYALVLKFAMFLHPVVPVMHPGDNYFYRVILDVLHSLFGNVTVLYSIVAFFLLFTQATLFNRICNYHKILPKPNFLPGMSYILITSLLQDWNHFSAPLIINTIMIWTWYRMVALYNSNTAVSAVFNIGLLGGLVTLLYVPAMAFLLLLLFALLIMRPFRIREWLVALLGFTAPYYFLVLILYFSNQLIWKNIMPNISFTLPGTPPSIWISLGIMLLIIPFMIGGYFVQNNLTKMLIQVRKSWNLLLVFLLVAVIVILINKANTYENWILTAAPFAAFHAAAYYYSGGKLLPAIIHWTTFVFIIIVNYVL